MANKDQFPSPRDFTEGVIILDGANESNAIDVSGATLVGIITDANIDGTQLTFKLSDSLTGTFYSYKTNDSSFNEIDVKVTVGTSKWYGLNSTDFAGAQFLKVVSNASQSGADTTIKLVLKGNC